MRIRSAMVTAAAVTTVVAAVLVPAPPAAAELSSEVVRTWGVTGLAEPVTTAIPAEVWALEQVGNTIYVGGRFTKVIEKRNSTEFDQPFLAAFDATTGVWIDWWRPDLDGAVYALRASPDGSRLFVGGEFTSVNGHPMTAGLVALDPESGDIDPSWRASLDLFWSPAPGVVRDLEIHGQWLYAGGNFTHVTSLPSYTRRNVFKVMRVSLANGAVDPGWRPLVTGGSVWSLAPSPDGARVYLTGIFGAVNGAEGSANFWTVDTVDGSTVPGLEPYPYNDFQTDQFGVIAYGDKVFVGGAQHLLTVLNAADLSVVQSYFTGRGPFDLAGGGDFQDIVVVGDRVYASCHCVESIWQGTTFLDDINGLVALDGATGDFIASWPDIPSGVTGPWAIHGAADGCLWLGGDMNLRSTGDVYVNSIVKLCDEAGPGPPAGPPLTEPPPDTTPPSAPGKPSALIADETDISLAWTAATDAAGVAHYNVYRDGTLVGAAADTRFRHPQPAGGPFVWTVTAVDPAGNESAPSAGSAPLTMPAVPGSPDIWVATDFDRGPDGFTYRDDAFRSTSQPDYASGEHRTWSGYTGGGLELRLGNVDDLDALGMSGGFDVTFTLDEPAAVGASFRYNVLQSAGYEGDEYSEALLAVDGVLVAGGGPDGSLGRVSGGDNLGWRTFRGDLGVLPAGSHTVTLGGFNNKKTFANELTQILFDDVTIGATAPGITITSPDGQSVQPGTVVGVAVAARDVQDALGSLDVQIRTKGGPWRPATWNPATLRYEASWDTTGLEPGPAEVEARVTDGDGNTAVAEPASIDVAGPDLPYPEQVLADGAVAYWRLGEGSGPVAADATGGNDGVFKGDPTFGRPGLITGANRATGFDGAGDRVNVPDAPELNTGDPLTRYSVELWFNADRVSGRQVLYEQGGAARGLAVYLRKGKLYAGAWNLSDNGAGTPWDPVYAKTAVAAGVTYHVVAVFDQPTGEVRLYLDGTLVDTAAGLGKLHPHAANIGIAAMVQKTRFDNGASHKKRGKYFNGTLDEVAIYPTALTPTTIATHHTIGRN